MEQKFWPKESTHPSLSLFIFLSLRSVSAPSPTFGAHPTVLEEKGSGQEHALILSSRRKGSAPARDRAQPSRIRSGSGTCLRLEGVAQGG